MEGERHFRELSVEWLLLLTGCVIYAASTVLIRDVDVIPGSFLGIAVALHKALGFHAGRVNLLMNIPVMILVTRKMGVKVLIYTIFIMAATSLLIDLWMPYGPDMRGWNVYLLSALGGVIMGIGAGLLLLAKGTMAGTTALTLLLQRVLRKLSFGTILFCIDSLIVLLGSAVVHNWRAILYSLLYSLCCAKTMDLVLLVGKRFSLEPAGSNVAQTN